MQKRSIFACIRICFGMATLDTFIDDRLAAGRGWFSRDASVASGIAPSALSPALTRVATKCKLAIQGTASTSS